jgi:hypothetical protein
MKRTFSVQDVLRVGHSEKVELHSEQRHELSYSNPSSMEKILVCECILDVQ